MGLFNGYLKEGPGVEKDAPEKHRFFLFFELFARKISKLIKLNLLYIITLIPLIIGIYGTFDINPNVVSGENVNLAILNKQPLIVLSGNLWGMLIFIIGMILASAGTAGFTYVIRNFQREQHSWVASDFFEHFKKNFKQSSALAVVDTIVLAFVYVAIIFYGYMAKDVLPEMASVSPFLLGIVCAISIIYIWMHYYLYVMMVTFDLSIKDMMRNAFLFALGKLPLNLFITAIVILIAGLSIYYFVPGVVLAIIISLSFTGYIIIFSVYPTIDNYLLTPATKMNFDDEE